MSFGTMSNLDEGLINNSITHNNSTFVMNVRICIHIIALGPLWLRGIARKC